MRAARFSVLLFIGVLVHGVRKESEDDADGLNDEKATLDKMSDAGAGEVSDAATLDKMSHAGASEVSDSATGDKVSDAGASEVSSILIGEDAARWGKPPDDAHKQLASSLHITYDMDVNWGEQVTGMYTELKTGDVAYDTYWAAIQHQYGYIGYQKRAWGTQGVVCSAWDGKQKHAELGDVNENFVVNNYKKVFQRFGGEGTGVQLYHSDWRHFVKSGEHLAFAMTFNYTERPGYVKGSCYVKYNVNDAAWSYMGSWYTQANQSAYMTGFLENWAPSETNYPRSGEYGNAFYRVGGQWKQSKSYSVDIGNMYDSGQGWRGIQARQTAGPFVEMKTCGNWYSPCITSYDYSNKYFNIPYSPVPTALYYI